MATTFAAMLAERDAVTAVNQLCQRLTGRSIGKQDLHYEEVKIPNAGFQTTVHLVCMDGLAFAGEVSSNARQAKLAAAQQVLNHYATEIANMPLSAKKGGAKKRSAGEIAAVLPEAKRVSGLIGDETEASEAQLLMQSGAIPNACKGELNSYYGKIKRGVIQKGEIQYHTSPVPGGFQSQVSLPGLPEPWGEKVWAGEVCFKKADAENSVAGIALDMIKADPELMRLYNQPTMKPMMHKGMGKGKGKGKGKYKNPYM